MLGRMLDLLGIGAVAFGVGLSGALSPGPLSVLVVREAPRRGWWAGPLATLGHGVVELALVIALALGLSAFVGEGRGAAVIAVVGGALLLWMGVSLLRSFRRASLADELVDLEVATRPSGRGATRALFARGRPGVSTVVAVASVGAVASVANPYWVVWWATVGTKLTAVAVLASSGHRWFGGDGWYRGLLGACGLFLLVIGLLFIAGGARSLM